MPRIGCHVSIAGGVSKAVERAVARECECIQIFTTSPRAWKHQTHRAEEVQAFREGVKRFHLAPVVVHASYLVNLASTQTWLYRRSITMLAETCRWAERLGCASVIIHVGHCADTAMAGGLRRAGRALKAVLKNVPPGLTLSLEMTAGGKGSIGASFDHFAALLHEVRGDARVRVWLDTAHAFAAGYDLRNQEGVGRLLADLKRTVGLQRVAGAHANDSKTLLGSCVDRHENIGAGHIGTEGFRLVLQQAAFKRLPFILETPGFDGTGPDLRNMKVLRWLA